MAGLARSDCPVWRAQFSARVCASTTALSPPLRPHLASESPDKKRIRAPEFAGSCRTNAPISGCFAPLARQPVEILHRCRCIGPSSKAAWAAPASSFFIVPICSQHRAIHVLRTIPLMGAQQQLYRDFQARYIAAGACSAPTRSLQELPVSCRARFSKYSQSSLRTSQRMQSDRLSHSP